MIYTNNMVNFEVKNIKFIDSPSWFTFFVHSKNIVFDHTKFEAVSKTDARPKNTDGFDSYNVDGLTVTNSELNVGDDCVSPKPNTTNIHIENVWCNGTHGVSMGSIGQYPGVMDYISNAYIKNVTLVNGQNGARLKAWAGKDVGYGYIRNITYEDIKVANTDAPLVLDQCYINIKPDICAKYPSKVNISDINFINFEGTSSGKRGDVVVELKCSPGAECKNIKLKNINIRNPKSKAKDRKGLLVCDSIKGDVGMDCISSAEAQKLKKAKADQ
jgi:galacturan 1,4-alpha-galacturonidase